MFQPDFRHLLKSETQADHELVDGLMSSIDLATRDGFLRFLIIHQGCFAAMRDLVPQDSETRRGLDELVARINSDLAILDVSDHAESQRDIPAPDTLAVDYVIEGSRLGSKVLKRRWLDASDPKVRQASAYFTLAPAPGRWRDICSQLSAISPKSDRALRIVNDTRALFALFFDAASGPVAGHL